ncbi:MAG: hypothetical protein AB7V62_11665 [Thermoleophilia bacterium]
MTGPDDRPTPPPVIDEDDAEVIAHPEEGFPADAPPEQIDAEQVRQAEVAERQKAWVDPREQVGGDD